MEIEAKFRADRHIFTQLLGTKQLGPFRLDATPEPENQHNVYFDTADARLSAARYGLRVRDLGGRRIATLKGGSQVVNGLHTRDEWEVEIGSDDRPETWPASEARDRALALIGSAPLFPIVTTRTLRRHIYAFRDERRILELSLDEGTIEARGRTEAFCELEVELLPEGAQSDLDDIIALLQARFQLVPENRGKLQRGLQLLQL